MMKLMKCLPGIHVISIKSSKIKRPYDCSLTLLHNLMFGCLPLYNIALFKKPLSNSKLDTAGKWLNTLMTTVFPKFEAVFLVLEKGTVK